MLDRFHFNYKKNYSDLKLLVKSTINFPLSNEEVESVEVEGRNGSLTINKGTYKDKLIDLDIAVLATTDFWECLEEIDEWLTNIKDNRLIFTDRPDKAYIVKRVEKGNLAQQLHLCGEGKITFICEPFLVSTNETMKDITNLSSYYYSGNMQGECYIKITGSGNIQLAINGETIQLKNVVNGVEIDSKYMTCKGFDGANKTLDMVGDFPTLEKGINTITKQGTITKLEILPRTVFRN